MGVASVWCQWHGLLFVAFVQLPQSYRVGKTSAEHTINLSQEHPDDNNMFFQFFLQFLSCFKTWISDFVFEEFSIFVLRREQTILAIPGTFLLRLNVGGEARKSLN